MYRQGDVLLIPVSHELLPAGARAVPRDARGRLVLALGEATGHAHALAARDAELLADPDDIDRRFLQIVSASLLTHEEHDAIPLPPGLYRVVRQREYSPGAVRQVAD
jgi:hypothetical protein